MVKLVFYKLFWNYVLDAFGPSITLSPKNETEELYTLLFSFLEMEFVGFKAKSAVLVATENIQAPVQ